VRILENRCAHRGPHLCGQARGNAGRLTCPYHAWTYQLDGTLIGIPEIDEYPADFDKAAHSLWQVPSVERYRGFIFARLVGEGPDLMTFLGSARGVYDDFVDRAPQDAIEVMPGMVKHRFRANWKMMLENLNDLYHAIFAHASATTAIGAVSDPDKLHPVIRSLVASPRVVPMFKQLRSAIDRFGHSHVTGSVDFSGRPIPRDAYFEALAAARGEERAREILSINHGMQLLYPSGVVNPGQQVVRTIHPISPEETEVRGYVFRLKGAPEEITRLAMFYFNLSTSAFSPIIADDLEIYERTQRNHRHSRSDWIELTRGIGADRSQPAATSEEYIRSQFRVWQTYMRGTMP
jgi:phenylpropionate dioxygenase-like ring-hydroxylating dioxygenase large terminal subunit